MAIVYCTHNKLNGKKYIGSHSNNNAKYLGSGFRLKKAFKKYGKKNFSYEHICLNVDNRNTLNFLEKFWIKTMHSRYPNGYNLEEGGTSKGPPSINTHKSPRETVVFFKKLSIFFTNRFI